MRDGESGVIISITSSFVPHPGHHRHRRGFKRRLEDMGLALGTRVQVVKSAPFHGPLELKVKGSRLAIGRRMAQKIMVRVAGGEKEN